MNTNIINLQTLFAERDNEYVTIKPANSAIIKKELVEEHDAQPIKNMADIIRIKNLLLEKEQYRDYMLFIIGINTGLRCSDLRELRFIDLIDNNFRFKDELVVFEQKTRNTRKKQQNRHIAINNAVKEAVKVYLSHNTNTRLDDYMFTSQSSNGLNNTKPIARQSIQNILVNVTKELDINVRAGTHMLRKTFSYHTIMLAKDRTRALELLQKILGHSNIATTLLYAGLTSDEINDSYTNLNLGLERSEQVNTTDNNTIGLTLLG